MTTRRPVRRAAASQRPPAAQETTQDTAVTTRAQQLAREAAEAAELRAYQTHPDVVALRVEQVRRQVDRLCWAGVVLGLAFTMTNVQSFAAGSAPAWSLPWLAAWLLDPMVSLILLAILRAEQVTARHQVRTGWCVRRAKWFTLGATYVMNTWSAWAAASASLIVLHSVPPLVVFVAAEAITEVRGKLTDAAAVAFMNATSVQHEHPPARRTTFTQYLDVARTAWQPGVQVTPAWVRQVAGCSRGLSSKIAAALTAELSESGGAR